MIAIGVSLLINMVFLIGLGLLRLEFALLDKGQSQPTPQASEQSVAMIYPEMGNSSVSPAENVKVEMSGTKHFARTSPDQAAPTEKKDAPFIGERDTQATSDRPPVPDAPPLPSQAGIKPNDKTELETTQSTYRDGPMGATPVIPSDPAIPPAPVTAVASTPVDKLQKKAESEAETNQTPGTDAERSEPTAREAPMEGPNPVDVQVPRATKKEEKNTPVPEKHPASDSPSPPEPAQALKPDVPPKPKPLESPSFKGYQRKTAMVGSISREGRSSLEVSDTALGRYEAVISRAVEQEWQRNCVRHRDFITPGFLTVRFFIEPGGKVRSVQFVGDMETGEIQKGFTLNSIRNAEIPAMPPTLAKEYAKEPLELVFRFYF